MKYILIPLLFAVAMLAQQRTMPGGGRQSSKSAGRIPPSSSSPDIVVEIKGTAAIVTQKKLTLTPEDSKPGEDSNTMDFEITRKTVVLAGDKKLKVTDLKAGDSLAVESKRLIDGTLEAVTVRRTGT
jgi:hypothetical protein